MDLTVEQTTHRSHGGVGTRRHCDPVADAIVVHGGDGSVNEVVNGLLGSPADPRPATLPVWASSPVACAIAFARALGIDADPLMATAQLIELLESGANRSVNLGIADGRWFLFSCGMGIAFSPGSSQRWRSATGARPRLGPLLFTTVVTFLRHRTDSNDSVSPSPTATGRHTLPIRVSRLYSTPAMDLPGRPGDRDKPGHLALGGLGIFASSTMGVARNLPLATRLLTGARTRTRATCSA